MKQEVFGMRRANGDWFVLEVDGQRRVLIFRYLIGAWRARAKNDQLMLFWPALIDERALAEFASADNGQPTCFWLIDEEDPAADLRHGHPLEYMQLCTLERLTESPLRTKSTWLTDQWSRAREWVFR
ncbi:MAG TPA: hypothetical protein VF251_04285 [Pyrinomonadaceae bacterium]|jgi:hypothetical protein